MKNLPIQIVETRGVQDQFLKEGMGDNKLPKWATQATVSAHAGVMAGTFSVVERKFDDREEGDLPVLMVASLDEKATVRKSFRESGGQELLYTLSTQYIPSKIVTYV